MRRLAFRLEQEPVQPLAARPKRSQALASLRRVAASKLISAHWTRAVSSAERTPSVAALPAALRALLPAEARAAEQQARAQQQLSAAAV